MHPYVAEFIGTGLLLLLGNGVVANAILKGTKGSPGSNWMLITAGWGFAVFSAVALVAQYSGAHINPAVTLGLAVAGAFEWQQVPAFIIAQFAGAFVGTTLVFLVYYKHYQITDDPALKLATFATGPAIRSPGSNLFSEIVGTFVLVFAVLYFVPGGEVTVRGETIPVGMGSIGALPVGLLIFSIGMSLGGTTGYAINPARDLGPRIAHALLPIPGKGSSDWGYAWVPVVGPLIGGVLAAVLEMTLGS